MFLKKNDKKLSGRLELLDSIRAKLAMISFYIIVIVRPYLFVFRFRFGIRLYRFLVIDFYLFWKSKQCVQENCRSK